MSIKRAKISDTDTRLRTAVNEMDHAERMLAEAKQKHREAQMEFTAEVISNPSLVEYLINDYLGTVSGRKNAMSVIRRG